MSGIDFDDWDVNLETLSATHACGFSLSVEGSVRNPSAVHPGPFPKNLSSLEQVRLLRHGVEALAKAAKQGAPTKPSAPKVVNRPSYNNSNRPKKSLLTLKRKSSTD
ncbi:hypothetical protein [Halioxenophilus sp. WMMB6]|uniref:hypothetical protein n=1 Tax=Halioxenophilus sp. WMMB6 TaxID=3073815 RepID=UPI00295F1E24|nr:hypothetical protein [Halioxenophilus sp. WMMB6]